MAFFDPNVELRKGIPFYANKLKRTSNVNKDKSRNETYSRLLYFRRNSVRRIFFVEVLIHTIALKGEKKEKRVRNIWLKKSERVRKLP